MKTEERIRLLEQQVHGLISAISRQANVLQKCFLCFELREMEELKNDKDKVRSTIPS